MKTKEVGGDNGAKRQKATLCLKSAIACKVSNHSQYPQGGSTAGKAWKEMRGTKNLLPVQIINMIGKNAIGHADSDAQMIGGNLGEFLKNMTRHEIDEIE